MNAPLIADVPTLWRTSLVEGHPDTPGYVPLSLEGLGYTVQFADSMEPRYDVLTSAIGLPDGDGGKLSPRLQLPPPVYAAAD